MKKNLLSILILALLVVNIVISVIGMISVTNASKKTSELVADIATIINLEIDGVEKTDIGTVAMSDKATYDIAEQMTIGLKKGEDGKDHYAILKATITMDTSNEDYATYGTEEAMKAKESLIKGIIFDVVGSYTADEANANKQQMRQEILAQLQELFGSTFITDIVFSEILIQ